MKRFPETLPHARGRLTLDPTRLLLALRQAPESRDALRALLAPLALVLEDERDKNAPTPAPAVNHTDRRFWVRTLDAPIDDERLAQIEKTLGEVLAWAGPVYRAPLPGRDGLLCPLPDAVLLRLRGQTPQDAPTLQRHVRAAAGAAVVEDVAKSRHLGPWRYFNVTDPKATNVYELRAKLQTGGDSAVQDLRFETMPLLRPAALVPNDPMFGQQWNMARINAEQAWDISTGAAAVTVCVLDEGCDLDHPDLAFAGTGINLGTMSGTGAPTGPHGTACAGIVAALFGNAEGVAGLAGNCLILPAAFSAWTDVEVAAGIRWAAMNGARVISMSFGWNAWDPAIIDPAIQDAHDADVVMCVATHNQNTANGITYPATNPLVMACGASDQNDDRKSPASPDGEGWGSNFGPQMSVVAPGVLIPTTDETGADGYRPGDYRNDFNGTSSATPLVAGLAALVRSSYPALAADEVRRVIERSAAKVGAVAYADTAGRPNGTWNDQMGYGRIDAYHALDLADVMLRDAPADTGAEPGPGGNFWDFSDIVVRLFDDGVFVPADPAQSRHLELGQTNYLYVRVVNRGPRAARNVVVSARLTPFVGTQFVYPHDWTANDATHLAPTPLAASFATLAPGAEVIAKFSISAAQVQVLWDQNWHPCCVAQVTADNDHAFSTAPLVASPIVVQRNNLAQRNLSVINVLADARGARASFPFIAGHALNAEATMQIVVDRSRLPRQARVRLALDEGNLHFPNAVLDDAAPAPTGGCGGGMEFLERTRVKTRLGCCEGVLTIEKGSRFDCAGSTKVGEVSVQGGQVVLEGGRRYVQLDAERAVVTLEKAPGQRVTMSVQVQAAGAWPAGMEALLSVAQQDAKGQVVGGASAVFVQPR